MSARTYMLAADAAGRPIVPITPKLTYPVLQSGACRLAAPEEQMPLLNIKGDEIDESAPRETDVIPHKAATDLIVMATAHAPRGKPTGRMMASISFDKLRRRYLVQGDRRCSF